MLAQAFADSAVAATKAGLLARNYGMSKERWIEEYGEMSDRTGPLEKLSCRELTRLRAAFINYWAVRDVTMVDGFILEERGPHLVGRNFPAAPGVTEYNVWREDLKPWFQLAEFELSENTPFKDRLAQHLGVESGGYLWVNRVKDEYVLMEDDKLTCHKVLGSDVPGARSVTSDEVLRQRLMADILAPMDKDVIEQLKNGPWEMVDPEPALPNARCAMIPVEGARRIPVPNNEAEVWELLEKGYTQHREVNGEQWMEAPLVALDIEAGPPGTITWAQETHWNDSVGYLREAPMAVPEFHFEGNSFDLKINGVPCRLRVEGDQLFINGKRA